ncbi:hypothetical protein DL771_012078 [Monosporascus sp. 5C6A]|nr:hypothetical protein DL771_012078 [Monosporascus sp. 5C6A]
MNKSLLRHAGSKRWIAQKFDGTGVGRFPYTVGHTLTPSNKIVVVYSVRSYGNKVGGITNRLWKKLRRIAAASSDEEPQHNVVREARSLIQDIRK